MTTNTDGAMPELLACPFCSRNVPDDLSDTLYPSGTSWREVDGLRHYISHRNRLPGDNACWGMHCTVCEGGCGAQITADSREEVIAAWNRRAAIQQAAGSVPEGWKLVPVHPTVEMLDAADEGDRAYTLRNFGAGPVVMQGPEDHYAAMLAASPAPPKQQPIHFGGGEVGGVPLSDAAIYDLAEDFKSERRFGGETYDEFDHYEFARAIESAHGIGKAPRNDAPIGQIKIRTYCEDCGKSVSDEPDGIHTCSPQYGKPVNHGSATREDDK